MLPPKNIKFIVIQLQIIFFAEDADRIHHRIINNKNFTYNIVQFSIVKQDIRQYYIIKCNVKLYIKNNKNMNGI